MTTKCPHYGRRCFVLAECCDNWVGCRLCHDAQLGSDHLIDRFAIEWMRCNVCQTEQPVCCLFYVALRGMCWFTICFFLIPQFVRHKSAPRCALPVAPQWLLTFAPSVTCLTTRGEKSRSSTATNAAFVGMNAYVPSIVAWDMLDGGVMTDASLTSFVWGMT